MALNVGLTVAGCVGIPLLTLASAFFSSSELSIFSLANHRIDSIGAAPAAASH